MSKIWVCQKPGYVKNPGMSKIWVCQKSGYVKLDSRNCLSGNYPAIQRTFLFHYPELERGCKIRTPATISRSRQYVFFPTTFMFWVSFSSSLRMPQQNNTKINFPSGLCHRNGLKLLSPSLIHFTQKCRF